MSTPPSTSEATPPTVEGFLKAVLRSGLLDRARLRGALRVPREQRDDPRALADHLVRNGHLSRFQAGKLLRGSGRGLILGPFQVLAPLGKGGMGTVYMARDGRDNRLVALKVLPPRRARTEERLLARFRREMELSLRVAHPHLAWTQEVGQVQGVHYIAMEYIPGKTLSKLVSAQGPLAVPRAARLMAEVASGLEHAHNRGLIHRDLKPSNILVTPNDHAKVLDLGLALMQDERNGDWSVVGGQGYIVGTMDYISPEQTNDALNVDRRSDVYSLGCTLYYALTGRPPFPGGTSWDKILRQRSEEPQSLLSLQPALPPAFAAVVHKMMAKDPAARFQSARAAEQALRSWADQTALPLDAPQDAYVQAVAAVETSPSSFDVSLPDVPLPDVPADEVAEAPLPEVFSAPGPPREPGWVLPLLIVLGLLLLTGPALLVLLGRWLLRM